MAKKKQLRRPYPSKKIEEAISLGIDLLRHGLARSLGRKGIAALEQGGGLREQAEWTAMYPAGQPERLETSVGAMARSQGQDEGRILIEAGENEEYKWKWSNQPLSALTEEAEKLAELSKQNQSKQAFTYDYDPTMSVPRPNLGARSNLIHQGAKYSLQQQQSKIIRDRWKFIMKRIKDINSLGSDPLHARKKTMGTGEGYIA